MTKIFISYRRDDSREECVKFNDYLLRHYGTVFFDVESIPPGAEFPDEIKRSIGEAEVVLAVIGPAWDGNGRLHHEGDLVRREIAYALDRRKQVLPVLVRGAKMPDAAELPPSLERLAWFNAVSSRGGDDLEWLRSAIARALDPGQWDGAAVRFADRVRSLLVAAGAQARSAIQWEGSEDPWFTTRLPEPRGVLLAGTTVVACTTREPTESGIQSVRDSVAVRGADHGILVVDDRVAFDGAESNADSLGVRAISYRDLIGTLVPLGAYFAWLEREYRSFLRSGSRFVDLEAATSERQDDGEEISQRSRPSLLGYVDRWKADESGTQLAVLGDFGSGKSLFCLRYANGQRESYESAPAGSTTPRIPILVSLGRVGRMDPDEAVEPGSVQRALFAAFCAQHGLPGPAAAVLAELNRQGRLLLICDGFDEFPRAAHESVAAAFNRLRLLAERESKLIVTSRTLYFRDVREESEAILGGRGRRFDILYLREFRPAQIRKVLEARFGNGAERRWEIIENTYGLLDLVRRPIILDMALSVLPSLTGRSRTTLAELYNLYTSRIIASVGGSRPHVLRPAARKHLMQRLAWTMFVEDTLEVRPEAVSAIVAEAHISSPGDVSTAEDELRTQTYLARDGEGKLFFAHRSFLEYFVATHLVDELRAGRYGVLGMRTLSPEILAFMTDSGVDGKRLYDSLSDVREDHGDRFSAGNILALLNVLQFPLRRRDFSGLIVVGANLAGADLQGSSFAGSVLESVNVTDANLARTDFTNTRFVDLVLGVRSAGKGVATSTVGDTAVTAGDNSVRVLDATGAERVTLRGPSDSLTSVQFSRDARLVASGSFDTNATVWTTDPGRDDFSSKVLRGHASTVYDLAFDASGEYLFTAGNDWMVKAWRIEDCAELWSSREHRATVYSINASPTGLRLATGSFDATVGLWQLGMDRVRGPGLRDVERMEGHEDLVNGVAWSPKGDIVASASNDGTVRLWDLSRRVSRIALTGHGTIVWSVAFSHDGRLLASGDSNGEIRVWDVSDPRSSRSIACLRAIPAHEAAVWSLAFHHDDRGIVSGSFDGTIRSYGTAGAPLWEPKVLVGDKNQRINCSHMRITGAEGLSPLQERFLKQKGART